jgi:hypothetical protein
MNRLNRKTGIAIAVGGSIVAGALILGATAFAQSGGGSSNQSASPTPNAHRAQAQAQVNSFLDDLAHNLNIDRNTLNTALQKTATDELNQAVSSGMITQSQANQIEQAIANGNFPLGLGGLGGLERGAGGFMGLQNVMQAAQQAAQSALSQALGGETADQIRAELQAGKSPADIAAEHNTTVQAVESAVQTAVLNAVKPVLAQDVQNGTITQAQADRITQMIQNGAGHGFGFFGFGGHGPKGGANGQGRHGQNGQSSQPQGQSQ